jgi:hypothetical protein
MYEPKAMRTPCMPVRFAQPVSTDRQPSYLHPHLQLIQTQLAALCAREMQDCADDTADMHTSCRAAWLKILNAVWHQRDQPP